MTLAFSACAWLHKTEKPNISSNPSIERTLLKQKERERESKNEKTSKNIKKRSLKKGRKASRRQAFLS